MFLVVLLTTGETAWVNTATVELVRVAKGEGEQFPTAQAVLRHTSGRETRIQQTAPEFVRAASPRV